MLLPVSAVRTVCTDNNYNTHPAHACSPRFTHPISFMIRTVFITLVYIYTHDRPLSRCPDACTTLFLTQPAEHSARSQSVCVSSFVSQPGHRSPHCPPAVRTMLSTPPSTDNRYTPSGVSLTQPTVTHVPHHHGTLPYGTVRRDEGIDYTTQVPSVALHTLLDGRTTTRETIGVHHHVATTSSSRPGFSLTPPPSSSSCPRDCLPPAQGGTAGSFALVGRRSLSRFYTFIPYVCVCAHFLFWQCLCVFCKPWAAAVAKNEHFFPVRRQCCLQESTQVSCGGPSC